MKRILIPVDGSDDSIKAIVKARDIAACEKCDVVFLYVEDYQRHVMTTLPQEYLDIAENKKVEILQNVKERFSDSFNSVETVAVKGDPANEIIEYAKNRDFDLVIMGSHGMGAAKRFFLGSVAHKVVLGINKPILIVK